MLSRRDVLMTTMATGASLALAAPASQPAKTQPARRIIVNMAPGRISMKHNAKTLTPDNSLALAPRDVTSGG